MPDTFQNRLKQALEIREMKPSELAELSGLAVVFYYSIFLYLILYNVNIDY